MVDEKKSTDALWVTEFSTEAAIEFHEKTWGMFMESPHEPLIIHIDSPGGAVSALISMMETMDAIRNCAPEQFFFITYAHGEAMSCGIHLLAHGDLRVVTPKSDLMFHELSTWTKGRLHHIENEVTELKRLAKKIDQIFLEDTGFEGGIEALKEWGKTDRFLSPKEAKKLGIIDMVGYIRPRTISVNPASLCDLSNKNQLSYRKNNNKNKAKPKKKRKAKKKIKQEENKGE